MKAKYRQLQSQISGFFKTEKGKSVLKWLQRVINVVVLTWLIYELSRIGWQDVGSSLPVQPLFYFLAFILFIQLPLIEVVIYRLSWVFNGLKAIPVFFIKTVYNKHVMGYSGELYFFVWAQKNISLPAKQIFRTVMDNNILSTLASTFVAILLLSVFFFTGQIRPITDLIETDNIYVFASLILIVVLGILLIRFRRFVIVMPVKTALGVFSIHTVRLIIMHAVNVWMYYIVLPDTPLYVWFTLLSIEIILSRIPLLPNRDLIFTGIGISVAGTLDMTAAEIGGILIAKSIAGKVFNLAAFGIGHLVKDSVGKVVEEHKLKNGGNDHE